MTNCPTCSQELPVGVSGLVQARVATRVSAERAARSTATDLLAMRKVLRFVYDKVLTQPLVKTPVWNEAKAKARAAIKGIE